MKILYKKIFLFTVLIGLSIVTTKIFSNKVELRKLDTRKLIPECKIFTSNVKLVVYPVFSKSGKTFTAAITDKEGKHFANIEILAIVFDDMLFRGWSIDNIYTFKGKIEYVSDNQIYVAIDSVTHHVKGVVEGSVKSYCKF